MFPEKVTSFYHKHATQLGITMVGISSYPAFKKSQKGKSKKEETQSEIYLLKEKVSKK